MSFTTRAFFWAFRACAHTHSPKVRGYPYPKTCRPSSSIPRAFIACNARVTHTIQQTHVKRLHIPRECTYEHQPAESRALACAHKLTTHDCQELGQHGARCHAGIALGSASVFAESCNRLRSPPACVCLRVFNDQPFQVMAQLTPTNLASRHARTAWSYNNAHARARTHPPTPTPPACHARTAWSWILFFMDL